MSRRIDEIVCDPSSGVAVERLDSFLAQAVTGFSRTYFQELIITGYVQVNGAVVRKSSYQPRMHDHVVVTHALTRQYDLSPREVAFTVLDEEPDFIVIDKPAGLAVHPAAHNHQDTTLINGLLHKFSDFTLFSDTERPGIVHRLDKDTSGLMLVARNIPAQIALAQQFKDRKVHKTYLAVVHGHPPESGEITHAIARNPHKPIMMMCRPSNAKESLTRYRVLVYYNDCALVEVMPVTGRTHQIRVHFAEIGHSLVGDSVYGKSSKLITRQALHAWKIAFEYGGKQYAYHRLVPDDFRKLLAQLSRESRETTCLF